jgi:dipeptidyl aminopeptidase/acylaminoacyl peptidase
MNRLAAAARLEIFLFLSLALCVASPFGSAQSSSPKMVPHARPLTDVVFESPPERLERGRYLPEGPFPAFITVHGAPGGRGISDLKTSLKNGPFVTDRFLKEGYVVVKCSYRFRDPGENEPAERDVASVIRFIKNLPDVDADKVCLYGTSRGEENSVLAICEEPVAGAIINDSGARTYMPFYEFGKEWDEDQYKRRVIPEEVFDKAVTLSFFEKIDSPTLFTASTSRNGIYRLLSNTAVDLLKGLGKESTVKVYSGERHAFNFGVRDENREQGPSVGALQALEDAVAFFESKTR